MKKDLFPKWIASRMEKEVVKKVEYFWLEPNTSFSVENTQEYQLDLPMMPKDFMFRSLDKVVDLPLSNLAMTKNLFKFCEAI